MTHQSFTERAAELVSRMTFEEKLTQLDHKAEAIPRLGIAAYDYWSEGLHGVARSGDATVFPTAIGLATSWNEELVRRVAAATSDEARAYANEKGKGLSYWSPTINLARDPRWGRAEETYGEDPFLTTRMGAAFVKGLEGTDEETPYLKAIATIKHFAANNKETNRKHSDSRVSERALREIYLKQFEIIVKESDPWTIMSSYNVINGHRASENKELLEDILRGEWGFQGMVTTDWWTRGEHYKEIKAGNDVKMATGYPERVKKAMELGELTRADLEHCARRVLELILKID